MFVLGLTGPSGAGKSFAADVLQSEGFTVIDADRLARAAVEPGQPCLAALAEAFGSGILQPDGSLDRKRLASLVFADREKLARLNAVTHPFILKRIQAELRALESRGVLFVLLDAPALYQSGADSFCTKVAAVTAPEALRRQRILARDSLTVQEADRRLSAVKEEYFTAHADYILENCGDARSFEESLRAFAGRVMQKAAPEQGAP